MFNNSYVSLIGTDGTEILEDVCGYTKRPHISEIRATGVLTLCAMSDEPIAKVALYDAQEGGNLLAASRRVSKDGKACVPVEGEPVQLNINLLFDDEESEEEYAVFFLGIWCGDPACHGSYEVKQEGGRAEFVPHFVDSMSVANNSDIPVKLADHDEHLVTHLAFHLWKHGDGGVFESCAISEFDLLPGDIRRVKDGVKLSQADGDVLCFAKGEVNIQM